MGTGTAVATGDLLTAAKMNLKLEDIRDMSAFGILDASGAGTEELLFVVTENLTADRNLTLTVNDAARSINLSGNLTIAGAFTTSGAFGLTLTVTALTDVTLPTTGTLASLAGSENLSNKTLTSPTLSGTLAGAVTFSGATLTFTGGTIALTAGAAYVLGTTDAFALQLRAGGGNRLAISNTIGQFTVTQTTADYTLVWSDPGAARTLTIPDPGGAATFMFINQAQTVTAAHTFSGAPVFSGGSSFTRAGLTATFTNSTDGASVQAAIFQGDRATMANNDEGYLSLQLSDSAGNQDEFARITWVATDVTSASEDASLRFSTIVAGTLVYGLGIVGRSLILPQATANYTFAWSDPAAARTLTIPDPLGNDTLCFLSATQTLTGKTISLSGNLTFASALDIVVQAATAVALEISDGTTKVLALDTRVAVDNVVVHTFAASAPTFASAAGTTYNMMRLNAYTVNLTGGVTVTAMDGVALDIQAPTIAAAVATTATTVSTVMIRPVTLGANMTFTNSRMINTSVAGCYLTAAGVWTDASTIDAKRDIQPLILSSIPELLDSVDVKTYRYRDPSDGLRMRYGLIAEEAPDFLASPDRKGIASLHVAGFGLAAVKWLKAEVERLTKKVALLEART